MAEMAVSLRSNLRVLLAKNKMNMTQLSEASGVSRATISEMKDDIPVTTKIITLVKLARPLKVEWIDMIDFTENDDLV
jgi:DNA-binding Xre family transcriptional regulator